MALTTGRGLPSLRIAHVVAHISPDGRYGGPLRVAADLARAQQSAGHVTELLGTYEDFPEAPTEFGGVPVRAYRTRRLVGRGYFGIASAPLLFGLLRRRKDFDVIHIHLARDLVTTPAALVLGMIGAPVVVQTHGMIEEPTNPAQRLFDRFTTRVIARRSSVILALTATESSYFQSLGAMASDILIQRNGVVLHDAGPRVRDSVTFLARLHPRKGARVFAEAAVSLSQRWPDVRFMIAGPDEGDLENVQAVIGEPSLHSNIVVEGPIRPSDVASLMARSIVYVLPAVGEPFGLTIIEALAQSTPVIIHSSAALAEAVVDGHAGVTYRGPERDLTRAIESLLLDRDEARRLGENGRRLVGEFDIDLIAAQITSTYPSRSSR